MSRREWGLAAIAFVSMLLLVLMLFITILGVVGRGALGGLMDSSNGVMFFVMVFFPLFAVALMVALGWWIYKRDGW